MTPFEAALHNFEAFAWSVNDAFGSEVSAIIARDYESRRRRFAGFGDAGDAGTFTDPTTGDTPGEIPASWDAPAETSVVSSLSSFLERAAGTIIDTAATYYKSKAQLATLKAQSAASSAGSYRAAPMGGLSSNTLLIAGGVALVAVVALTSRGGGRR